MSAPCINLKLINENAIRSKISSFDMEEPDY